MKRYNVRLTDEATIDLSGIYALVRERSTSIATARAYVGRIRAFLTGFDVFPERGTPRDNIRQGLRIVGFERRVSVAFVVEDDDVVILRILYAGQRFDDAEDADDEKQA